MGRLWGWASGRGGGRLVAESPVRGVQDRPRASCLTLHGATAVAGVGSPGDSATVRVRGRPRGERPGRARACARLAELKSCCPAGWAAERPV